ncbi:HlyD family secretion protein [Aneurinibacillus terranovensis]|uniref:HlyD family secretion protein n=1 Tax=Aneurinibacillus terranovensis TaxID=278991 RepID=UPI000410DEEF|nr:HlyD family efflux transporter periplasmic adaptor subunit [Aneurinibacillus terranovensis]
MRKRYLLVTLFAFLLLTGCQEKKGPAVYSGTIEGTEILIQSELAGAVANMLVDEGANIKAAQPVAKLDDRAYLLQVQQARAGVDAARAKFEEAKAGSRSQEISQALSQVEQTQAGVESAQAQAKAAADHIAMLQANRSQLVSQLDGARKTLAYQTKRLHNAEILYKESAIAQQDMDALREAVNQAQTQTDNLKAQIQSFDAQITQAENEQKASEAGQISAVSSEKAAQAKLDLLKAGNTDYTLRNLLALVEQADSQLAQAKLNEAKTVILSPDDGIMLRKHVENGEIIKQGATLYTLLKKGELKVVVYVPEAQLNEVKVGEPASIAVDAYPDQTFKGKVTRIASEAEFTPKNVQTPDERTKMVFAVTVELTEGLNVLKPGMPADVTFANPLKAGEKK